MTSRSPRRVLLEPLWKLRREFQDLLRCPPEGYEFLFHASSVEKLARKFSNFDLAYRAAHTLGGVLPINLARAWTISLRRPIPGIDLIYAVSHPVFVRHAWLLDMRAEQPPVMVGGERPFRWYRAVLRRLFASPYCRGIIYEVRAGQQAFLQSLEAPELEPKVTVIRSGIPLRESAKKISNDRRVKLLFVNSANINAAWNFAIKGGLVLLEAYAHLRKEYDNLELTIRSVAPTKVLMKYQGMPGLRIIDRVLPWAELEREFRTADIFVLPSYVTPSMVFLDAMSYGLPVVTTDVWANSEFIRDGENGIVISNPLAREYTDGFLVHFDSTGFRRAVNTVDRRMVRALVSAIRVLVENPALRQRLGEEGRRLARGTYSLDNYRRRLKEVLDRAVDPIPTSRNPTPVSRR